MKMITTLLILLLLLVLRARADTSVGNGFHLSFENDWSSSRQVSDVGGSGIHFQFPTNNLYTAASVKYSGLQVVGRTGSGLQQTNFGNAEYFAQVVALGGDTNSFPGYTVMSYAYRTNVPAALRSTANGTITAWVWFVESEAQNTAATVFCGGFPGTSNSIVLSRTHNESDSKLAFSVLTNASSNPQYNPVTFPAIPTNQWYHLAVTWDAGANQVKAYTNGALHQTGAMNAGAYLISQVDSGQYTIVLQASHHGDPPEMLAGEYSPNNGWMGAGSKLDEMKFADRTFSAGDVLEEYNRLFPPAVTVSGVNLSGKVTISSQ